MKKYEFDIIEKIMEILDLYVGEDDIVYESGDIPYIYSNKSQLKVLKFSSDNNKNVYLKEDDIYFNPLRNSRLSKFILDDFMHKNDIDEFSFFNVNGDKNGGLTGRFIKDGKIIYEMANIHQLSILMISMIIGYSEDGDEDYYDIIKKIEKVCSENGSNRGSERRNKKSKVMV